MAKGVDGSERPSWPQAEPWARETWGPSIAALNLELCWGMWVSVEVRHQGALTDNLLPSQNTK